VLTCHPLCTIQFDDCKIVSGSQDGEVILWDFSTDFGGGIAAAGIKSWGSVSSTAAAPPPLSLFPSKASSASSPATSSLLLVGNGFHSNAVLVGASMM
jgi:hypothetical protein